MALLDGLRPMKSLRPELKLPILQDIVGQSVGVDKRAIVQLDMEAWHRKRGRAERLWRERSGVEGPRLLSDL